MYLYLSLGNAKDSSTKEGEIAEKLRDHAE